MEHLKTLQAIAHISELAAKDSVMAALVQDFAEQLKARADEEGIKYCVLFPESNPIADMLDNQYKQDLAT